MIFGRNRTSNFSCSTGFPLFCGFACCILFLFSCASSPSSSVGNRQDVILHNLGAEYYFLAEEYVKIENYDKALELFQKVLGTGAKTDDELTFKIARTAALAKNWDIALENYNALLLLDPPNLALLKSVAWIHAQKGDLEMSRLMYAELYDLYNYDEEVCTNYIVVLAVLEQFDDAKIILASYEELYPEAENLEELNKIILDKEANTELEDTELNQSEENTETTAENQSKGVSGFAEPETN